MRVLLVVVMLPTLARTGGAQDQAARLEPGYGVGNVKIGDSIEQLKQKLDPPEKMSGYGMFTDLEYPLMSIRLSGVRNAMSLLEAAKEGQKPQNPKIELVVDSITTYDPLVKTRGGLTIGSSLEQVLDIFGDTAAQFENRGGNVQTLVSCAHTVVYKYPENRPSVFRADSFEGYVLMLHYLKQGISFYFTVGDKRSMKVEAIGVSEKKDCEILFAPNKKP